MRQLSTLALASALLASPALAQVPGLLSPTSGAARVATEISPERVLIEADSVTEDDASGLVIAEGQVEARFEGRFLRADRVVYDLNARTVRATGNVEIIDPDGSVRYAQDIEVQESLEGGFATGFSTRLLNDAVAIASSAQRLPDGKSRLRQVIYTACRICENEDGSTKAPTWALRAGEATLDPNSQMISYRDTVLEVGGVPVLYLPYFAHPDPNSKRRSGLLYPDIGVSSTYGAYWSQPYLLVLGEDQDIVIAPQIMQDVNPLLAVDWRKRFFSGEVRVQASGTYGRKFDNEGEFFGDDTWQSSIAARGNFKLSDQWKWGFGVERMSDIEHDRRFDLDVEGEAPGLFASQSRRLLSQVFLTSQTRDSFFNASMVSTQSLRPFDTDANLPLVAPSLYGTRRVNLDDWGLKGFGEINLRAAGLYTEREDFIKVGRINAEASWSRRTILPGGFVLTPFAGLRLDQYEISRANSDDQSLGRDAWWAGSELSWPLYTSSGGVGFIVEPKVMFATGTEDPNDPDIFNQDSLSFSADAERILDAQPIDGFDLLDEGTRVAVGVQTQARWGGQNRFGLFVGQRFSDADKPALSRLSNLDREQSDIVSRIQLGLGGLLSADTSLRYDAEESELTAASTLLNLSLGPATLGVGHYFTSDLLTGTSDSEALALTSRVRLSPNWAVLGRMTRNLATEENVQQRLGLEYSDDCSTFQLLVERDRNEFNRNRVSTNIRFRIALRTLAEFGANDD